MKNVIQKGNRKKLMNIILVTDASGFIRFHATKRLMVCGDSGGRH